MTDPLPSHDVELLKRYDAQQQELETLPPAAIELSAEQALAIVTHIHRGAANEAVKYNPLLPSALAAAGGKSSRASIPTAPFTPCWNSAGVMK